MNTKAWLDAAERYKQKAAQPENKQESEAPTVDLAVVAQELLAFLTSAEGDAARQLLSASGRHIVIAEENDGGGMGVVFFLDGNGLQQSIEAMGTWMAYSRREDIPKPKIISAAVGDAVVTAARTGEDPSKMLWNIRLQLNKIAEEVL